MNGSNRTDPPATAAPPAQDHARHGAWVKVGVTGSREQGCQVTAHPLRTPGVRARRGSHDR
jgi:hypothetical protein